jgi:hypothetical protein
VSVLDELAGYMLTIPDLPGARCKGNSHVWESDCPELIEYALSQCAACRSLSDCERYLLSLKPRHRPVGVMAGRVVRPPRNRSKKAAA